MERPCLNDSKDWSSPGCVNMTLVVQCCEEVGDVGANPQGVLRRVPADGMSGPGKGAEKPGGQPCEKDDG